MFMDRRLFAILLGTTIACMLGCQSSTDSTTSSQDSSPPKIVEWGERESLQKERAESARSEMFAKLTERLSQALTTVGPVGAITVCQQAAPEIAVDVSRDGVKIGRTSFHLRNQINVAPTWAAGFVERKIREPVFVSLEQERLGALFPIRLLDNCVMCHGKAEEVGPEVLAAIQKSYPEDRATGFSVGDLRGYFWVEVE